MPAITQEISPYVLGVSQEPDVAKQTGFLNECQNGYPDIIFGLQKRPGSKYLSTLLDLTDTPVSADSLKDGQWFSIIRDDDFPYFGVILPAIYDTSPPFSLISYGELRIWNAVTTKECNITYLADSTGLGSTTQEYLTGSNRDDYKTITIDKVTTILNRSMVVTESVFATPGTLTGTVSTFATLPTDAVAGDIFLIVNSENTELDDYYVEWDGSAWTETILPGIPDGFNNWTAPHALVKTITNPTGRDTWTLGESQYLNRTVGDESTNSHPSFVGNTIQDTFFYFNRLGFLSADNIIMSQPIKPDYVSTSQQPVDFYVKSAQVSIASDPVDLNASSVRTIRLSNVLPAAQGLILFANNEQFMLYADSGVVTPQTTIIKSISNYEMDEYIRPIELGEEFYFLSKTPRYARIFRMITRGMENDPIITEASKIASEYIPSSVNKFVPNPQNQFIAISASDQPFMWFYKQFMDSGQRQQVSWFKWKMQGNVFASAFADDRMFSLLATDDDKIVTTELSLNKSPDADLLTAVPNPQNDIANPLIGLGPYLDCWTSDTGTPTYDPGPDETTIPVPTNYPILLPSDGFKPCLIFSADPNLRSLALRNAPGAATAEAGTFFDAEIVGNNFVVKGNFTSDVNYFVIGYKYDMVYDLPTTYFRLGNGSSDYTASLRISRYKFSFSSSGIVDFQIKNFTGDSTYVAAYSVTNPEFYKANSLPVYGQVMFTVPIHQRNEYFKFRIFSDSPYPSTLNKLMWEGVYTPRYYQRS